MEQEGTQDQELAQEAERSGSVSPQPIYAPEDNTTCWICGGPVIQLHCKIICRNCGFMRDCSDP